MAAPAPPPGRASRAVAVVPAGRAPQAPLPAVVVRGREPSAAASAPEHAAATPGKSGM